MRFSRATLGAVALSLLLVLYIVTAARAGVALIRTGEPVAVGLGAAVLVLPALGLWLLAREWWLALAVQSMADELEVAGRLPVDDVPRWPSGRPERGAADVSFAAARAAVEAEPDSWERWFALGFAYDAARDRRRARMALRTAARLRRGAPAAHGDGPTTG